MAEIFGAVASGAGLISLAVQLLESSQKLKAFCNAGKDAPKAVAELNFQLETMSLSLRNLERHRQSGTLDDELLSRCILTCTAMVGKIESAVGKMERQLQKSRNVGRLYAAFKEPEIRRLLEDLAWAKNSMYEAQRSCIRTQRIRQEPDQIVMMQTQNASNDLHLRKLDCTIQAGHADFRSHFNSFEQQVSALSHSVLSTARVSSEERRKRRPKRKLRLALPRWFTDTVWEFGATACNAGWIFQLDPINVRPFGTYAFDVVRSGNVGRVRKLLASGELSGSNYECDLHRSRHNSLPEIAAAAGRLELCDFLLQEFPSYRRDEVLRQMLKECINFGYLFSSLDVLDSLTESFYKLFIGKYDLQIDLQELVQDCAIPSCADKFESEVVYSERLTKASLRDIIESQPIPFKTWPSEQRFSIAVNSRDWPPDMFIEMARPDALADLATYQDSRGRTALHWAAEHFAQHRAAEHAAIRHKSLGTYAKLAVQIINKGADLHAFDYTRGTPFSCMLQAMYRSQSMLWTRSGLAEIVRYWGCIVSSGCNLDTFARRENSLQSQLCEDVRKLRIEGISNVWMYRLSVSKASELTIEVEGSLGIRQWQFRPPPGAWERPAFQIDRISWKPDPYFEGDDYYMWRMADRIISRSTPILMREKEPPASSLARHILEALEVWIKGVQDDHGFVATKSRRGKGHKKLRRAASLPGLPTLIDGRSVYPAENNGLWFRGRWMTRAHRCPLDMSWKYSSDSFHSEPNSTRRCMQGSCDDWEPSLLGTDTWEVRLIEDGSNIEAAKRFTERFRPEWRGIVDENEKRAKLGTRLRIGPAMRVSKKQSLA